MSSTPSPKDWLILQCQACGSPMKVRAEAVAGQRVACPVCRSPVAVQAPAAGGGAPEFRAHMPQDSDRVSPSRLERREEQRDEEFSPTPITRKSPPPAGQQFTTEPADEPPVLSGLRSTEDMQSGRKVKVKKRRKNASANHFDVLADWDTALGSLPEAELYSDPWTAPASIPEEVIREKTRDFVVEEQDENGATVRKVKRVRKRRLFSWAQLFFRRLSFGMRILTITVVSAIALGSLYWGFRIFQEHFKPVTYDEVVADIRPRQEILAQQDESGAFDMVKAFLAAKGPQAKLPFVRLPNRVRPLMDRYYSRTEDKALEAVEVLDREKFVTQGAYFVLLEVLVKDPASADHFSRKQHFAVEEKEDKSGSRSYLVDWETAVEWREMTFEEFKASRPQGNVPFRVKLRGSDYYNHGFIDQKKWFATEIYYPQAGVGNETLAYGYMDRNSEVFRKLSPIIESGLCPPVILNLRYPSNPLSPEQVVIDSVIRQSWFFVEDVPPTEYKPVNR